MRPLLARKATSPATARQHLPEGLRNPIEHFTKARALRGAVPMFERLAGKSVRPLERAAALSFAASVRSPMNEDLTGISMLRFAKRADMAQMEREWSEMPGVVYAHRVPARWLAATKKPTPKVDPLLNRQWGLRAINWFATPEATRSVRPDVRVGVLDTGIDRKHPDFEYLKLNYRSEDSEDDIIGHGTHVAGIIAADAANDIGVSGICRLEELHVWKIFGDEPNPYDGEFYVDDLLYQRALGESRSARMNVINLSIGGTASSKTEEILFKRLIDGGTTVVAAMGNEYEDGNPVEYPGAYKGVIAVGAVTPANRRARFSNTGKHITLSAPGTGILSTLPTETSVARDETGYAAWDGTSMATPHVVAAAAVVLSEGKAGSGTPAEVRTRLTATATKLSASKQEVGSGLLNLAKALS
ncbi:MAG: S8 family serine peptidase [Myxococcota bacterium]